MAIERVREEGERLLLCEETEDSLLLLLLALRSSFDQASMKPLGVSIGAGHGSQEDQDSQTKGSPRFAGQLQGRLNLHTTSDSEALGCNLAGKQPSFHLSILCLSVRDAAILAQQSNPSPFN